MKQAWCRFECTAMYTQISNFGSATYPYKEQFQSPKHIEAYKMFHFGIKTKCAGIKKNLNNQQTIGSKYIYRVFLSRDDSNTLALLTYLTKRHRKSSP